jgi:hypothetical protein
MERKEGSLQFVARRQSMNRAKGRTHKDKNAGITEMKSQVVHSAMMKEGCTKVAF